jgi:ankyrin repeat protein
VLLGKAELVTALLDKGARPDLKDETGAAPVHLAVVSGTSLEMITYNNRKFVISSFFFISTGTWYTMC